MKSRIARDSEVPASLRYSKDHEWVRVEGDVATIGITDHAQHALGDITYVELPPLDKRVKQSDELAAVESAKAASDIYAPVSGAVTEVNAALEDTPEKVNVDPYGEGWICKLEAIDASELDNLLTARQYRDLLAQEEK